jgi:NAD(P)-dependent dehydrogenase (short-subunit alcohol dehydrogenase family)
LPEGDLFFVSGGSGGIGSAVCDRLALRGLTPVVGYCRNREAAERVAMRTGGTALALDLTSTSSIASVCDELAARESNLAGFVLAGSPPPTIGPFGKITAEDMTRQWQVNVMGPQLLLAGLVRRCFRRTRSGSVVGVLTRAMGTGIGTAASDMGAYVIAKYGLAGVLAALAADYTWLRVRSVSPGYTETPMLSVFDNRFLALQRERQPFQTPDEVARQIVEEALGA